MAQDGTEERNRRKARIELSNAMTILDVKHATLSSLVALGRIDEVRNLLSTKLMKRTKDFQELGLDLWLETFDPELDIKDFMAVHEAYQALSIEFVEKGGQSATEGCFLSIDQIRANHSRRGSKSNASSRASSRRGSDINPEDLSAATSPLVNRKSGSSRKNSKPSAEDISQHQLSLDAEKLVSELLVPSSRSPKSRHKNRRASLIPELDIVPSPSMTGSKRSSRRGSRRGSMLLSSGRGSRRGSYVDDLSDANDDFSEAERKVRTAKKKNKKKVTMLSFW